MKKFIAEFIGTLWLVFGGCGSAILAAAFPELGIGFVGVSLAFGLTVVTMAYAIGHISGCHLNPAVSIGLAVAGRFDKKELFPYIISQLMGAIAGAALIYIVASGKAGFELGGFAANGFGEHSPGGYNMVSAFVIELVLTFVFLFVILGATHSKAPANMAGLSIGLALALIHLISIPVTNTSVNPARSTSQALFADGSWAIPQLWLFWVAPILGAILAGVVYSLLSPEKEQGA
ncbi:Aquaporin Z [Croceitalea dokdonensis DOKDO 023]|uniref:Aquaporin Z n=1 Tax=Croceitalea dokdonensis DOKDO 023 TaxID=1300341 RepID=A0A0P7AEF4_9FLAO|nr:aquaporin Z [Croceitalea dokdonensis]KPM31584.1 Aquaporin Z [Croceitalea dokdonensis DOKDO 023]